MKIYGEIHDNMSVKEQLFATNKVRNTNGWFDRLFEMYDFRGSQKDILFEGGAVAAKNDTCAARYSLTMNGDLQILTVREGETKCVVVDRLSGEKKVDFYVRHDAF